jgi:hypothetical protein
LSTISSDVPSDEEEEEKRDTSVSIHSDSARSAQQHQGGLARHRRVIVRLEGIGFDSRDACPEWAFDNDDISTVSVDDDVDDIDASKEDA